VGATDPLLFCGKYMARVLNEDHVQSVVEGLDADVEVLLVEQRGSGPRRVVRVFIDHPAGVTHELCGGVSRAVEDALETNDLISGDYVIEVSSPGLDRPLRTPAHFAAQRGKRVRLRTALPINGRKTWDGVLVDSDDRSIVICQDGTDVRLEVSAVTKANLVYDFGQGARE